MTRRTFTSASTRVLDETDSGVGSGSSQASSPATSSVSSVETTSDDLIDFGPRTSTFHRSTKGDLETAVAFLAYLLSLGYAYRQTLCFFPSANDVHARLDAIIEEGESLLRRSYDLEKGDLALSLSLATNAASE